jgi:hypothetical protein
MRTTRLAVLVAGTMAVLAAPAYGASTYTVSGTVDDAGTAACPGNVCPSVRDAINGAESDPGSTIQLGAARYTVSSPLPALSVSTTIQGQGSGQTAIVGPSPATIGASLLTFSGGTSTVSGVEVTGASVVSSASPFGGAIFVGAGSLTLRVDVVDKNAVNGVPGTVGVPDAGNAFGGAIWVGGSGTLALVGTAVSGNQAIGGAGFANNSGAGGSGGIGDGGAIYDQGALTVTGSTITGNTARGGTGGSGTTNGGAGGRALGGGLLMAASATATLTSSTISGNSALGGAGGAGAGSGTSGSGGFVLGGGIYDDSSGQLALTMDTLAGNQAVGGSGATGGATSGSGGEADGGGVDHDMAAPLTINASTISGNKAAGGAAGSGANGGRGIGGGASLSGTVVTVNSTVVGNVAAAGSGASSLGVGGGLVLGTPGSTAALYSDTIVANQADSLGGNLAVAGATFTLADTIVAHGAAPAASNCQANGGSSIFSDNGRNLEDTTPSQCGFSAANADLVGVDPRLGALASNGGPTQTLALGASSPALGAGGQCTDPTNGGARLTVDQRGLPRRNPCDIGGFEAQSPALVTAPWISGTAVVGQALTCATGTFSGDQPLTLALQWLRDGAPIAAATAATYTTVTADAAQLLACRVTATNPYGRASGTSAAATVVAPPRPAISGLKQSHTVWREGSKLATLSRKPKHPVGTTFSFMLSTSATVTLHFTQTVGGRKAGKKCVAQTTSNRHKRACKRTVSAGTLTFTNAHAGADKISFQGSVSRSRELKPGRYTLQITAANGAGRATSNTLSFTIVRR